MALTLQEGGHSSWVLCQGVTASLVMRVGGCIQQLCNLLPSVQQPLHHTCIGFRAGVAHLICLQRTQQRIIMLATPLYLRRPIGTKSLLAKLASRHVRMMQCPC
jgi:hypothetical protein